MKVPFPYIVVTAALAGLLFQKRFPQVFCIGTFDAELKACVIDDEVKSSEHSQKASIFHLIRIFVTCLLLWIVVVGSLWFFFGTDSIFSEIALFFSKAAFITFGGAYAVLSYITEMAVSHDWLTTEQMLIGLGLAESTPGPLIMVTQYVGFLGAWNFPADLAPLTAGMLGALVTTYVTFLPCFFFIFAGAPYMEAMAGNQHVQAALTGVTAAVVGVVLNLGVWFGYKVMLPKNNQPDLFAIFLTGTCLLLIQWRRVPIHCMVPLGAGIGIIWKVMIY